MTIEEAIKFYFPEAKDITIYDPPHEVLGYAYWRFREKEYSLSHFEIEEPGDEEYWYVGASKDNEDWGTYGDTEGSYETALENAAQEDWSEHGFMLNSLEDAAAKIGQLYEEGRKQSE